MPQQEQITKSDFDSRNKVVQANQLIQKANTSLNGISLKLFKAFISCINTDAPPKDNKVYMKKEEIIKFFDDDTRGNYTFFKQQMYNLKSQSLILREGNTTRVLSYVREISWQDDSPYVMCQFEDAIMPYLINLKKDFLQYPILNIVTMNSKYTVLMYENLLSMARGRNERDITISVEDLRILMGTTQLKESGKPEKVLYKAFRDFERRVIKVAVNEINEIPHLEFLIPSYDKIRTGRSIHDITFHLRVRTSFLDTVDYIKYPDRLNKPI